MTDPSALTITEAASLIGVKPQRISKLISIGRLKGPAGNGRPNQPRVWRSSAEAYKSGETKGKPGRPRTRDRSGASPTSASQRAQQREEQRRWSDATFAIKAALEVSDEQLAEAQLVANRLRRQLAEARADIEERDQQIQALKRTRDAFGEALTQLSAPDHPPD